MKPFANNKRNFRAGYSLVEVTLALLVVAIGLTATFALFPEGLRASRAAVDDTETAMFAEYVFTTLDLTAALHGGNFGPDWNLADTDNFMSLMLSQDADQKYFRLETSGNSPQVFYWCPDFYGLSVNRSQSDMSFEYFQAGDPPFWTSAFTYTLTVGVSTWKGHGNGATTYAVLRVWPGEYPGTGLPPGEPRIFYREVLPVR